MTDTPRDGDAERPDALLPCPFCGNSDRLSVADEDDALGTTAFVGCAYCDCRGPFLIGDRAKKEAIAAWNERSRDAALREARAEVDRAVQYLQYVFKSAAPQCEPFGRLLNLCTQIDNLIVGQSAEIKQLRAEVEKSAAAERAR